MITRDRSRFLNNADDVILIAASLKYYRVLYIDISMAVAVMVCHSRVQIAHRV